MIISNILLLVFLVGDIAICTAPEYQEQPSVAFDGNNYLVVWKDKRSGDCDIWGQFVSQDGSLVDTNFPICVVESNQISPEVCFGTTNYLVIWKDIRGDTGKIYGQKVSPGGILIDTEFIINDKGVGTSPDIVFGNTNFMVVWNDYYDIGKDQVRGRQVSQGGIPIDTSFIIPVTGSERNWPHIAFSDTNYLVVWEDLPNGIMNVNACIISADGVPLDTGFLIIEGESSMIIPDVASCGENYLVLGDNSIDTIFGRLISTTGIPLSEPFAIATEKLGAYSVIWTDSSYLVVWGGESGGPTEIDVFGQWLSKGGVLIDTCFTICDAYLDQYRPVSAYGNDNCLVVWSDTRNWDYDVYGSIVSFTGVEESEKYKVKSVKLEVCPNPFTAGVRVKGLGVSEGQKVNLKVYDMMGRLVEETKENIIGKNLQAGIYFVKTRGYEPIKIIKLRRVR